MPGWSQAQIAPGSRRAYCRPGGGLHRQEMRRCPRSVYLSPQNITGSLALLSIYFNKSERIHQRISQSEQNAIKRVPGPPGPLPWSGMRPRRFLIHSSEFRSLLLLLDLNIRTSGHWDISYSWGNGLGIVQQLFEVSRIRDEK